MSNQHDRAKVLAELIGQEVIEEFSNRLDDWLLLLPDDLSAEWQPEKDHSQMAQVEAWLVNKKHGISLIYEPALEAWECMLWEELENRNLPSLYSGRDPNKLAAMAKAVCQLKGGEG